jgi:hypothetical protein
MLRRVALERTNVSEELRASIIMVTRIGELSWALSVQQTAFTFTFRSVNFSLPFRLPCHHCHSRYASSPSTFELNVVVTFVEEQKLWNSPLCSCVRFSCPLEHPIGVLLVKSKKKKYSYSRNRPIRL